MTVFDEQQTFGGPYLDPQPDDGDAEDIGLRIQEGQYQPSLYLESDPSGHALPDTFGPAADETQIEEAPYPSEYHPTDYADWHNAGLRRGYLSENPGLSLTKKPSTVRPYQQPRRANVTGYLALATKRISGFNFKETAGATASVTVYQGADANQQPIAFYNLAPNESARDWFSLPVLALGGIYVKLTGAVDGFVYTEETEAPFNTEMSYLDTKGL